jgi:hypothetical protein
MRLKILVVALVASLVAVSAALAHDNPGKGHKQKTGPGCKPAVAVVLSGTLGPSVDPQDGDGSFVLTVLHSNRHGRAFVKAGSVTILVDAKTRVRREGAHNLGALAPNDRVHVLAKACKADLKNGGTPDVTARKIGAHPGRPAGPTGASGPTGPTGEEGPTGDGGPTS